MSIDKNSAGSLDIRMENRGIPKFYIGDREFECYEDNDLKQAVADCMADGGGTLLLDTDEINPPASDCPIVMAGEGDTSTNNIRIMGNGIYKTEIIQPESKTIFEVKNGLCLGLENLAFWTGTTGTFQPFILGEDDGDDVKHSISRGSYFDKLYFRSRSGPTGTGYMLHLKNPWRYTFGRLHGVGYSGTGFIEIEGTDVDTSRRGDSSWNDLIEIALGANDMRGIKFTRDTADPTLVQATGYIVIDGGSNTGGIGIEADYLRHSRFPNVQIENIDQGFDLDYCMDVRVGGPYMEVNDNGTIFKSSNSLHGCALENFKAVCTGGETTTVWDVDNNTLGDNEEILNGRILGNGTAVFTHVANTRIKNIRGDLGQSEVRGQATITNALDYVDVTHGLLKAAAGGELTALHAETTLAYISDYDQGSSGTTTRISCGGLTGDRLVEYFLSVSGTW